MKMKPLYRIIGIFVLLLFWGGSVRSYAQELNATVTITSRASTVSAIREGRCDLALVAMNLSEAPNLSALFTQGGGLNLSGYSSETLTKLVNGTLSAATEDEFRKKFSELLLEKLRGGLISLAVITPPCDNSLLNSFCVGEEKMTALMSKYHPLAAKDGNARAQLALDKFSYEVKKLVGAYAAVMGGCDAIVFTAGVGENAPATRAAVCEGLAYMGVKLDPARNAERADEHLISADDSAVKVFVIATNEELMIARDTKAIVEK